VAERLDERSAQAVEQLERTAAAFRNEVSAAGSAFEAGRRSAADAQAATIESRRRSLSIASAGLLIGALVAVAGATLAVASARRELASIGRDQSLLNAINSADLTLCGERVCARIEPDSHAASADGAYRTVAPR
jgi:hypothetical protein